jgi:hypothetical protein
MSAPAAKALEEPVRTMAPMVGEAERDARAVLSSVMRGVERALRALGRERVTALGVSDCLREDEGRMSVAAIVVKYLGRRRDGAPRPQCICRHGGRRNSCGRHGGGLTGRRERGPLQRKGWRCGARGCELQLRGAS